jgi:hypothetical protein
MSNSRVNLYSYMAASNPYFVKSLAHKYGYDFDKDQNLASVLQQLVSYEGEPVLMEIIENNPDRDLFMEYFEKKYKTKEDDRKVAQPTSELATYMNFTGQLAAVQQLQENKKITTETSLMVLAGAMLIAFAIITTKK